MTHEEISQLKETVAEESKVKVDHVLEGDVLANMAEGEGWKIMIRKANKKILELLEPISREEVLAVKDLELIGAMAIARGEKIEVLRWFINEAESEKNAKRQSMKDQKEQEESKPEA